MASTADIVQNYQSMFAHRYTTEDKEYQKYLQCSAKPPPIIEDWMNRSVHILLTLKFCWRTVGSHNYAACAIKAKPQTKIAECRTSHKA